MGIDGRDVNSYYYIEVKIMGLLLISKSLDEMSNVAKKILEHCSSHKKFLFYGGVKFKNCNSFKSK